MNIFVTSDTHAFHANIIKPEYCNRPFRDVDHMNAELIRRWNELVKDDDLVYHLGDVGWGGDEQLYDFVSQLRGRKILVLGNHDTRYDKKARTKIIPAWIDRVFENRHKELELHHNGSVVILKHHPYLSWEKMHHGSYHVHGHCHLPTNEGRKYRIYDAGVDANDFAPVLLDNILGKLKGKRVPENEREIHAHFDCDR